MSPQAYKQYVPEKLKVATSDSYDGETQRVKLVTNEEYWGNNEYHNAQEKNFKNLSGQGIRKAEEKESSIAP
jgi:hypothetical protein